MSWPTQSRSPWMLSSVQGGQLGQGAAVALTLLPVLLVLTVSWLYSLARAEEP